MMTWQTHLDKVDRPSIEDLQKAGNKARSEVKKAKEKLRLAEQWFDRVLSFVQELGRLEASNHSLHQKLHG